MKYILAVLGVTSIGSMLAQNAVECPTFDTVGVVAVEGIAADELYRRAKHWFVNRFVDAQEVIQLDDAANGTIIGKGYFGDHLFFTVEIAAKDGRYRYNLHGIYHEDSGVSRGLYGIIVENLDYGNMYNCKFCSDYAQAWRVKHPNQHQLEKDCMKTWVPRIERHVRLTVASITSAMSSPTPSGGDW